MYEGLFWPYGGHYGVEEDKYAVLNMQDEMLGRNEIMNLPMACEDSSPGWNAVLCSQHNQKLL